MEVHQSAYCAFHSTETAFLKVKTDVTRALKNHEVACLILLDLSTVFNTINDNILFSRLETRLAVTGTTQEWLRSYLTERTQAIAIGDPLLEGSRSAFVLLNSGIPQGLCSGSNPVHHLYNTDWQHMQKQPHQIPPLC